jgi:hypothetical protein
MATVFLHNLYIPQFESEVCRSISIPLSRSMPAQDGKKMGLCISYPVLHAKAQLYGDLASLQRFKPRSKHKLWLQRGTGHKKRKLSLQARALDISSLTDSVKGQLHKC